MLLDLLQYIGSGFVLTGQVLRAYPKQIVKSLIGSVIGSAILLIYSLVTGQHGFVILNLVSILANAKGAWSWNKKLKGGKK